MKLTLRRSGTKQLWTLLPAACRNVGASKSEHDDGEDWEDVHGEDVRGGHFQEFRTLLKSHSFWQGNRIGSEWLMTYSKEEAMKIFLPYHTIPVVLPYSFSLAYVSRFL